MAMVEVYRGVVHPWLCDVMGHMTTRHYAAMFDDAAYHLLAHLGFTADHLKQGIGIADVQATLRYKAELGPGELVLIRGGVSRLGEKSLTMLYQMENLRTHETAAEMEMISVQFDLKARKAVPLLPEIRTRAEAMLES
jgi:acyl-CoA thioester hydrolase